MNKVKAKKKNCEISIDDMLWGALCRGPNSQTAAVFMCICRQPDGDTLFELWRCYPEQAQPHMSLPEGQRVKSSTSGVNTHTLINMQELCPNPFGLTSVCCLTNGVCLLYSAPDPDVADAHIPVDKLPRWDYSMYTILWFIFSEPFLRPTSDCKHVLVGLCRAAVD